MATPIVEFLGPRAPAADAAPSAIIEGGSTPAERLQVWDFDDTTQEYVDFECRLSDTYASGGLTLKVPWGRATGTGTSVGVRWTAAIRRLNDDAEDLDSAHTYSYQEVTDNPPSGVGLRTTAEITFTDGAQMDSLAAGEYFVLRISRDPTHADDDMTGDARLYAPYAVETGT